MTTTNVLKTHVRKYTDKAIIDLHGEINGLAEQELEEAYAEAVTGDVSTVVLNFIDVDYINSTGIALIVTLLGQARMSHRSLSVYGLSPHYQEIFNITRLSDFMTIYQDENAALEG